MVLRPKKLVLGAATLLVLAAAGGGLTYARTRPEMVKEPRLRYEQTPDGVKVYISNPNKTWGLRNQRLVVILIGEQRNILRSYGPDERHTYSAAPGQSIACCLIEELPPKGEHVFSLWPMKPKVAGVTIDPDPKPKWVRWH